MGKTSKSKLRHCYNSRLIRALSVKRVDCIFEPLLRIGLCSGIDLVSKALCLRKGKYFVDPFHVDHCNYV